MLKTKVMEDLDALLADLQSTTSHISSYQEGQQTTNDNSSPGDDAESRESTPPPLPPPPPKDVYDELNEEPLYEPQQLKHAYHSNVSNTAVTRSHASTHQVPPPASFTPPPPPSHPPPPVTSVTSPVMTSERPIPPPKPATKPKPQMPPPVAQKPVSMLSNNLTELDMLLQDLSSAQFMAEVDRRNLANISNHGASETPPPQQQQPQQQQPQQQQPQQQQYQQPYKQQSVALSGVQGGDRSVDSLLIELENTATPPGRTSMSSHLSMDSMSSHYEAVRPRVPSQHLQSLRFPPQTGPASTATRELDDLMASLSDFKVSGQQVPQVQHVGASPYAQPHKLQKPKVSDSSQAPPLQHVGEPPYAQPHKLLKHPQTNFPSSASVGAGAVVEGPVPPAAGAETHENNNALETMLGNLNTDMSRQGIMTIPKGHCAACAKPIVGQVITALGRIWHPEHFTCTHCKDELGTRNFFERDGLPYCERDYHNLFSPRCGHCNGPILDKCVTALDNTWHPEHFFCASCGRLFGDDGFHEKDGHAYCREDYFELFAPKCGGCRRPIMDNYISALNRQWHPECFICTDCRMPFGGGSFFDHEGMPYCETHYHAKRGSLCAGCMKPITGRCITAMYKKFHPEHFVCAFCLKQLNKGTFKEQNDKPYCHPCFVKLFG